ncbi:hypothetical protein COEREDRAFT_84051 [Coemansia reversa NRRL 1564]|uniref:Uncharacterized protein n=1 Tax=Coemansia reversa (strain ATCC 12441 / NRRL 1564) TaxID=763665 RepID=A0A2G5B0K0_COERN|nr:hypothetical protein COEREDRAFT_84051 [Coemansia reversa NRRL 1564]|eukprot:PIA12555.1 hypothetical protein COEREDRAFT_84051 [Coemansia reversa NRRL 1564]
MPNRKDIDLGANIIVNATLNAVLLRIANLKINDGDDVKEKIVNDINDYKELEVKVTNIGPQKKSKKKDPSAPKRTIKPENQCTGKRKDGSDCNGPMCSKDLKLCWGHMNKDQREEYSKMKNNSSNPSTSRYKVKK